VRDSLARRVARGAGGDDDLARVLHLAALESVAECRAGALALADKHRLELAGALAERADLVLVDELLHAAGPATWPPLMALLGAIRDAGAGVLWIEHYRAPLMTTCDRLLVLRRGQNIAEGTVAEIQAIEATLGLQWR
jgi:ABC-type branched-subunit amino acid transport system ATPase component